MFTTFSVEDRKLKGIKRVFSVFYKDRIIESYLDGKNLAVRKITYINYRDKINWNAVYRQAGSQARCLVCSDKIHFPENSGLRRFCDNTFVKKMTCNFGFQTLKSMNNPQNLNVGFIDADGSESEFLWKLCTLTDNLVVVTGNREKYEVLSDELMEKLGVSLVYTNRLSRIKDADLVIAPCAIKKRIDLNKKSVVLTSEKPFVDLPSICYWSYTCTLPEEYRRLMDEDMDEMYFASALYSKGRKYFLGEIVPKVAYNENSTCTVKSLGKYLGNH
ncbi:MAG: hypothetical protein ACI4HM_10085 [Ruminococcus sp.]